MLIALFFLFDDDDSGTIGAGELKMMLRDLGFSQISRSQCKKLIQEIDIDGSGDISSVTFFRISSKTCIFRLSDVFVGGGSEWRFFLEESKHEIGLLL